MSSWHLGDPQSRKLHSVMSCINTYATKLTEFQLHERNSKWQQTTSPAQWFQAVLPLVPLLQKQRNFLRMANNNTHTKKGWIVSRAIVKLNVNPIWHSLFTVPGKACSPRWVQYKASHYRTVQRSGRAPLSHKPALWRNKGRQITQERVALGRTV